MGWPDLPQGKRNATLVAIPEVVGMVAERNPEDGPGRAGSADPGARAGRRPGPGHRDSAAAGAALRPWDDERVALGTIVAGLPLLVATPALQAFWGAALAGAGLAWRLSGALQRGRPSNGDRARSGR
jgi:hypothetical protein